MHFVCVYTTGRNVWLLLKYYLHGFAEEEEKALHSNPQMISCSVCDGLGSVCLSSQNTKTDWWLQYLDWITDLAYKAP